MPLVNYCRKCKTEVPVGDSCPYCSGKLTQAGEMISFGTVCRPVREWFAWNGFLRILLPVLALVMIVVVAMEACAGGEAGVIALLKGGFLRFMAGVLAVSLGAIWLLLSLQGMEKVHTVLDKQGVHVRTYIQQDNTLGLYARFATPGDVQRLTDTDDRQPLQGLLLVRRVTIPWTAVRRVRIWREGSVILFFRPRFWQAAAVICPLAELPETEAYVRKKLKRQKKTHVLPLEKEKKNKKG